MNKNIFREYDIRGKYPEEINEDVYSIIGKAIAVKCQNEKVNNVAWVETVAYLEKFLWRRLKNL